MMRIVPLRPLLLVLALAGLPACAPAKGPSPLERPAAYARTPGQTLGYRYVTESSSYMWSHPEADRSRSVRDARVAIRFAAGDTAHAWIESLRLEEPEQPEVAAGADVVNQPFLLKMGPLGIDSILSAPAFTERWSGLKNEFNYFLPRLPGGLLSPGREWQDVSRVDLSDSVWAGERTREVRYRVVGAERMGRTPVAVVEYGMEVTTTMRMRNSGRYEPGQPPLHPIVHSTFQKEEGRIWIAPGAGHFVRRTRTGVVEDSRTSYGNTEAATWVTEYNGTYELVSPEPA